LASALSKDHILGKKDGDFRGLERSRRFQVSMISLTALVLTYNEQENIRRNLEALVWVPKVIIVDSFSNDQTLEIARSFPNVQVVQRDFDTHANQWNAGLDRIDTEWALTLDADYVLTAELQEEIKKVQPASDIALYWGEFDYCIFGRPLRASVYPPRVILFRTKRARYVDEGHTQQLRVKGKLAKFKGKIWQDHRKPLNRWFHSQWVYSEIGAAYLLGPSAFAQGYGATGGSGELATASPFTGGQGAGR